ncbi:MULTISPECIES: hypothetical protein [unclassified Actinomadura]|uniref:hypothetical protein n=1 Tax=unclassified Actinomadura TaxID=2626254 RepID=UPI0011ED7C64|nr:hypothetical protein [Actinomadura sp. K4S16]
MAEEYPQYYTYERRPVAFVKAPDGGLFVWALSPRTGEFQLDKSYLDKIWFGTTADIDTLSRDEFIQRVEEYRGRYLRGEGPAYALYETINGLLDAARAEPRPLTPEEKALVHTLRLRVHDLFEAELRAQGRQGTPEDA